MKKFFTLVLLACLIIPGCKRLEPMVYKINKSEELKKYEAELEEESLLDESIKTEAKKKAQDSNSDTEGWIKKEPDASPVKIKAVYIPAAVAGSDKMDEIISHIDKGEINALVIDFKDDNGRISCRIDNPMLNESGACTDTIDDISGLVKKLHEHGIYVIARSVCFRDPYLAEIRPDLALHNEDGSIYRDSNDMAWINPYKKDVWEYMLEIGKSAARIGFDEVQFDYVRFSTGMDMENTVFNDEGKELKKTDIINEFVKYASDIMAEEDVFFSCDVFGSIIASYIDSEKVGQNYSDISQYVDYICPMIYPSHYTKGNFGLNNPDLEPYKTIKAALENSKKTLKLDEEENIHQAIVRPWLQAFTASYLDEYRKYGEKEIREEIQAVYDSGYEEWILWNPSGKYPWEMFVK